LPLAAVPGMEAGAPPTRAGEEVLDDDPSDTNGLGGDIGAHLPAPLRESFWVLAASFTPLK
jgi:hypothetical protein